MRPRELYGVLLRFAGTMFLMFAVFDLAFAASKIIGSPLSTKPLSLDLVATCLYLAAGVVLVGRAEWIVRLAYGPDRPDSR